MKKGVHIMEEHKKEAFEAPGTLVLVFIFFASFVLYYFANWKWLANLWYIK